MYRGMYIARDPYSSDLHSLIRENYRQVFFNKENIGVHLPYHLEREFKKYLRCGNLAFGMARFHCSLCQKDKLVAFSCKGRTLCPSCTGRRMSDTAKHLIEEVIPAPYIVCGDDDNIFWGITPDGVLEIAPNTDQKESMKSYSWSHGDEITDAPWGEYRKYFEGV